MGFPLFVSINHYSRKLSGTDFVITWPVLMVSFGAGRGFLIFLSWNNSEDNNNCYTCYLFLLHPNAIFTKLTVGYIHQSQIMRSRKKPGVIINIGSAAGLYPMFADPIYTGTKGSYTILYTSTFSSLAADHSADARPKYI